MKVSSKSWHWRMYNWFQTDDGKDRTPSVCEYAGTLFFAPIFFSVVGAVASPIFLIVWLWNKTGWKVRGPRCPFGVVETTDGGTEQ